jgi:hypothetical protein
MVAKREKRNKPSGLASETKEAGMGLVWPGDAVGKAPVGGISLHWQLSGHHLSMTTANK